MSTSCSGISVGSSDGSLYSGAVWLRFTLDICIPDLALTCSSPTNSKFLLQLPGLGPNWSSGRPTDPG